MGNDPDAAPNNDWTPEPPENIETTINQDSLTASSDKPDDENTLYG